MRAAKNGHLDAAKKLMCHPLAGRLFDTTRPADPVYAMPAFWAFYSSQLPALRDPEMIEVIES
jgi:hypothetical protein